MSHGGALVYHYAAVIFEIFDKGSRVVSRRLKDLNTYEPQDIKETCFIPTIFVDGTHLPPPQRAHTPHNLEG